MKKILSFIIIAVMASCGAGKKAAKTPQPTDVPPPAEAETAATVLSKLNRVDFRTFSGKVDVDFDDGKGNGRSVSAKLVMKKDEAIWLSAGLLGFEGVRALITKDSVKILNKLQKEYTAASLQYIREKIGLPVDFSTLENLLIGNAVFVNAEGAELEKDGDRYLIKSEDEHFKNLLTILMPGYLPSRIQLSDVNPAEPRNAELSYGNYLSVAGRNFSTLRDIVVNHKNKITIRLDFKSHDFNGEVSMPFSIPTGYKTK